MNELGKGPRHLPAQFKSRTRVTFHFGNCHVTMPIMHAKTTLDRFGRVLVPKKLRMELGISPGDPLEIESREEGILIKPIHDEPHLVDEDGILVFSGASMGDIADAVRKHREQRLDEISDSKK